MTLGGRVSSTSTIAAGLLLALGACSGGGSPPAPNSAQPAAAPTATPQPAPTPATTPAATPSAQVIFDGEFTGTTLDTSTWVSCYPWGSAGSCTNNQYGIAYPEEEQYRASQLVVGDGTLQLVAARTSVKSGFPWTSGMITTGGPFVWPPQPTFAYTYGYAEMRAQLPAGAGFWPAFWLVPANGSWPPEIDIMEWQGAQPQTDFMTVHFSDAHAKNDSLGGTYDSPGLSSGFHTYGVDWEPNAITWYLDGAARVRVTAAQFAARGATLPNLPMYVIVNLAVGGWVSGSNAQTPSPAALVVQYVRVWNRLPQPLLATERLRSRALER